MDLTNLNKDRSKKRKPSIDMSAMVYGKIPPQAKDIEEAILGAILLEKTAFDKVSDLLKTECFYVDAHQRIYAACQRLVLADAPIDSITVVEELRSSGELEMVGGPYAIVKLTNNVVSAANIEYHSRIVYQKFMQRELIRIGGNMVGMAYEDDADAFDMLDDAANQLSTISVSKVSKSYTSLQEVAIEVLKQIEATRQSDSEMTGVPSGISKLDLITQGWQPTNLIILAARPAVGKSAVAANLAFSAATNPVKRVPTGVFSLEMATVQWIMRILSGQSEIDLWNLKRGRVTDNDMARLGKIVFKDWSDAKIFFDDTSSLDLHQLKAKAREMVRKEGVGLIIVDYLQLTEVRKSGNENREQQISRVSRELKQLAKELKIPVIALSQLSRKGEGTAPKLSDLRESGAIEQDADDVIFLIEPTEDDIKNDESLRDSLIMKIAKHRNGIQEDIAIKFVKKIQKLMSEDEYESYIKRCAVAGQHGPGNWKPVQTEAF